MRHLQELTLDISKEPIVQPVLYLGQGDANGTTIQASLFDNGSPLDLANCTVKACIRSADGEQYYETDGTVDGNVATFYIDETYAASTVGTSEDAYVEVVNGTTYTTSTSRFVVVVLQSAQDGANPSQAYSNGIIEATNRANAAAEAAEGVVLDAVPLMSSTVRGGAQVGTGLKVENGALCLDATTGFIPGSEKGAPNGVAELDSSGILVTSQLPSYVDDVVEYTSRSEFPAAGESGKIYVAADTNMTYRWTGTTYAEISSSLALGETSSTAYRGDRGAAAYAHAVTNKGAAFASNLYKITTNAEGHVTAATPATSADIVAFLNNQTITPASVSATGAVSSGGEVSATEIVTGGTNVTHNLTDKLDAADYRSGLSWDELEDRYTWDELSGQTSTATDTTTTNLSLTKPGGSSHVSVDVMNDNMDIIDDAVGDLRDSVSSISYRSSVKSVSFDTWQIVSESGIQVGIYTNEAQSNGFAVNITTNGIALYSVVNFTTTMVKSLSW